VFGIGAPELIFILVLALLIFGPKRLPQLSRTLGKGMAEFRRASTELQRAIHTEIEEPPGERRPVWSAPPEERRPPGRAAEQPQAAAEAVVEADVEADLEADVEADVEAETGLTADLEAEVERAEAAPPPTTPTSWG